MPIKIPHDLPGRKVLEAENVPLIPEDRALRQDIRPLQVLLLNLMPDKIRTETQFLRVLGATPLQIEMTLLRPATHESKNTSLDHLLAFYQTWDDVKSRKFDAMIVTGAPVEQLDFEAVNYWPELQTIFDWAQTHVHSSFFVCWGAQAALYHYHGVPKYSVPQKQFGVYRHSVLKPFETITAGFDDMLDVPVSRNTETRRGDLANLGNLEILIESDATGVCLIQERAADRFYMLNHLEYDADTMVREYLRDRDNGIASSVPHNYFPDDDPEQPPRMTWRAHRNLLFGNWINHVYQTTPYDLDCIKIAVPDA